MGLTVVVGAAIVRDGAVLAQQRAYPPQVAGLWEVPGGRVEPGETETAALARECVEELGVEVLVGERLGPDIPLTAEYLLRVYACLLANPAAVPEPRDHLALRWLTASQLGEVTWLPADEGFLPDLRALLTPTPSR